MRFHLWISYQFGIQNLNDVIMIISKCNVGQDDDWEEIDDDGEEDDDIDEDVTHEDLGGIISGKTNGKSVFKPLEDMKHFLNDEVHARVLHCSPPDIQRRGKCSHLPLLSFS